MKKRRSSRAVRARTAVHEPCEDAFPYKDYVEVKKSLAEAIQAGPFYAVITGRSGAGKTCLYRDLVGFLDPHRYHFIYLSSSQASLVSVLRFMTQKFNVLPKRSCLETSHILANTLKVQSSQVIAWIDEADELPQDTLRELRILAESDAEAGQLFSVVLSGLPKLRSIIDGESFFPLKRRISCQHNLVGLLRDELPRFLVHRFGTKAASRVPKELIDDLFERTQAMPALIDKVVRHALRQANGTEVTEKHLLEGIEIVDL